MLTVEAGLAGLTEVRDDFDTELPVTVMGFRSGKTGTMVSVSIK